MTVQDHGVPDTSFNGTSARRSRPTSPLLRQGTGSIFGAAIWPLGAIVVVFLAAPIVALVWRTLGFGAEMTPETWATLRQALWLSLTTTLASMVFVVGCGTPLAYVLARRRFRGRIVVDTLVDLPIVLPPAVAGIALLMTFGRRGVLGEPLAELGITIPFTTMAVVIAQSFVAMPFFVRAARSGFARVGYELEAAAADLGAGPWRVFWTITLPLARSGLAAGAILAWARALGEFGATLLFAGNLAGTTQTMPLAIYGEYNAGDLPTALLLAMILLIVSLVLLLLARAGSRRDEVE